MVFVYLRAFGYNTRQDDAVIGSRQTLMPPGELQGGEKKLKRRRRRREGTVGLGEGKYGIIELRRGEWQEKEKERESVKR